ncbi:universal stress protein [Nitrosopumilus sp. S4]
MKNILVPHDFTDYSDLAFREALEISKKFDSKITLLTIIGNDTNTSGMSWSRAQEVHDEVESKARDDLNKIKNSNLGENMSILVELVHNPSTANGILSFAESHNIDLIIMGSHGRSGFKKLVLGSVALEVVTKSKCKVLIVKQIKK